jgi:hypothetical protein
MPNSEAHNIIQTLDENLQAVLRVTANRNIPSEYLDKEGKKRTPEEITTLQKEQQETDANLIELTRKAQEKRMEDILKKDDHEIKAKEFLTYAIQEIQNTNKKPPTKEDLLNWMISSDRRYLKKLFEYTQGSNLVETTLKEHNAIVQKPEKKEFILERNLENSTTTTDNTLFITFDGALIDTTNISKGYEREKLSTPAGRIELLRNALNFRKSHSEKSLLEHINTHRFSQHLAQINLESTDDLRQLDVTNKYPGITKTEPHHLIRTEIDGRGQTQTIRIHKRNHVIELFESRKWQGTPEDAINIMEGLKATPTSKYDPQFVVEFLKNLPAGNTHFVKGEVNGVTNYTLSPNKNPNESAWSLDDTIQFTRQVLEQTQNKENKTEKQEIGNKERLVYLRAFSQWAYSYEKNLEGRNFKHEPEKTKLAEFVTELNTKYPDDFQDLIPLGSLIQDPKAIEDLATKPENYKNKVVRLKEPKQDSREIQKIVEDIRKEKEPNKQVQKYRESQHELNHEGYKEILKYNQNAELFLAIAHKPDLDLETRKTIADYAPGGELGEKIQIVNIKQSLLDGAGTTVIGLTKIEPRGAVVAALCNEINEKKRKEWISSLNSPHGNQKWLNHVQELKTGLGEQKINRELTGQITGEFIGYDTTTQEMLIRDSNDYVMRIKPQAYKNNKDKNVKELPISTEESSILKDLISDTYQEKQNDGSDKIRGPKINIITLENDLKEKVSTRIQRCEAPTIINEEDVTKKRGHSAFHASSTEAQEHYKTYVQKAAEIEHITRLLADSRNNPKGTENALAASAEYLLPSEGQTSRQEQRRVGSLEWATPELHDDPKNPLPGNTPEEKEFKLKESNAKWELEHQILLYGKRNKNKELIKDETGKVVEEGLVTPITEHCNTAFKTIIPPQDIKDINHLHMVKQGIIHAEQALTKHKHNYKLPYKELDEIDQKIATLYFNKKNKGYQTNTTLQLPEKKEEYLQLRTKVLNQELKEHKKLAKKAVQKSAILEQVDLGIKNIMVNEKKKLLGQLTSQTLDSSINIL